MTDKPRQQMRELIAAKLCDKDAYCNECAVQADAVMELFPDVEVNREHQGPGYVLGANGPAFGDLATHTRLVLRTAPEPIEETQP